MKSKKCILLVRVSTEAQSYDEQERELFELAKKQGYLPEQITPISRKESGIKIEENEREGLNEMKRLIETGEYDCVFAWEISRIARRKAILFSVVEYLIKHEIQLIIKDPNINLLNHDGSINEAAEMVFTLFAQLAESEMRNKKARFTRAKKEGYRNGKYMGGRVKFGYKVNEQGYIVIDEESAKLVRLIYDLYITGKYSMTELAIELRSRGMFASVKNITNTKSVISHILKDNAYIGKRSLIYSSNAELVEQSYIPKIDKKPKKKINNNIYPRIIDEETWAKCVERRSHNIHRTKEQQQYLLTPLIHCKCGASYCVNTLDGTYECRIRHNAVEKGLIHNPAIQINLIESLVWYVTVMELTNDMAMQKRDSKEEYAKEIELLRHKIGVSEQKINDIATRRNKLDESYFVTGSITNEQYNRLSEQQNSLIAVEQENIRRYNTSIRKYNELIKDESSFGELISSIEESYDKIKSGVELDKMHEIIHRYITNITIEAIEGKKTQCYKKVTIATINDKENAKAMETAKSAGIVTTPFARVFFVNSIKRKVYFDENMSDEVPMIYIDRIKRRREHTTRNGKSVQIYPFGKKKEL